MKTKTHSLLDVGRSLLFLLLAGALATPLAARAQSGSAMSFDGLNDYVVVPPGTWFSNEFTIETWVYERSYSSYHRVIDFGNGASAENVLLCLSVGTTGRPLLQTYPAGQYVSPAGPLPLNQWVHLAATLRSNTGIIYVNGAPVATNAVAAPNPVNRTINYIGRSLWTADAYANAMFDNLRIWSVARSAAEIQAGMNQPLTGAEPGLLASYRFDEGSGTRAYDNTGHGLDGILVNSPSWTWVNSSAPYVVPVAASYVSAAQSRLNGLVNANGLPTTAWFDWGTSASYGNTTTVTNLGSGTTIVPVGKLVFGLSPNVTYHYRLTASNNLGVAYSSDRTFTLSTGAVTNLADSGAGSLRQAIANAAPGTTLLLTNTGTITLTSGDLAIYKDLSIVGPGASALAISANNASRVFNITPNVTVNLSGLTIRNGRTPNGANATAASATGSSASAGGGIYNAGQLTLSACVITGNSTGNGGAGGAASNGGNPGATGGMGGNGGPGGGIYNDASGVLTLDRCTVSGNSTGTGGVGGTGGTPALSDYDESGYNGGTGGAGGAGGPGAGIFSAGIVTLDRCTVNANTDGAGGAGGLGGHGGDNDTFWGSHWHWGGQGGYGGAGGVGGAGGGISGTQSAILLSCTVSGNASGRGGAGGKGGDGGAGSTTGRQGGGGNGGPGGNGGGIYNDFDLALFNSTISFNATGAGGAGGAVGAGTAPGGPVGANGISGDGGGISCGGSARPVQMANSIIGQNTLPPSIADDVFGSFSSSGHNLIGNTAGGTGFVASDLLNLHPILGALADNGGPTRTCTPLPGSPALDAGDNAYARVTDQRGLPRLVGGKIDIGAVEFQYWPAATTLPASDVGATGTVACATVNGIVNPGGPETTVAWFEWEDGAARRQTAPMVVGSGTLDVPISARLTNLIAGLTYRFRVIATNSMGFDYGSELRFCAPSLSASPMIWICHDDFIDPGPVVSGSLFSIAAGGYHNLALKPDGTVTGWGRNDSGQTNIPAGLNSVVAISAGGYHSLALKSNGGVVGWGNNDSHQTNTPASLTNAVAIAAGGLHTLALTANGTVLGWGENGNGQTNCPAGLSNVVAIAAGDSHSLALKSDGTVIGWGYAPAYTNIPAGLHSVVAIAAGGAHSLALTAGGTVSGWGNNTYSQATIPSGLSNVVAIAAGYHHSLALKADGTLVAWGRNAQGQTTIPAGLNSVVAIAAGYSNSVALKADGTVVGWGYNLYGQTNTPAGMKTMTLPASTTGAVDVNVPGSYELTYRTTNLSGGAGMTTRTVQVIPATPVVITQPATGVGSTGATLRGQVNPRGAGTMAWFEYGLTTKYGSTTAATNLGSYPYDLAISSERSGLLPWMTYHFRAVASNSVGRIDGQDVTFTLSGPYGSSAPTLSQLNGVTIRQGGSTNIHFTVSSTDLDVRIRCNNRVLLPDAGFSLSSVGTNRWLSLTPNPNQCGSALITVVASDGMHAISRTFPVTVTPLSTFAFLSLTNAQKLSGSTWRFTIFDYGTASSNYVVEYRSGLSPTNDWSVATNVTWAGSGLVELKTGGLQGDTGFYRVRGSQWLTGGLDSSGVTLNEGEGGGAVLVLNGLYTGTVNYTWGGTEGTYTGSVEVNGTTAFIPVPAAFLTDNTDVSPNKYLTLQLDCGTSFALAGAGESGFVVEENDAEWQGTLIVPNGLAETTTAVLTNRTSGGHVNVTLPQNTDMAVAFVLRIDATNGCFQGRIESEQQGFFSTNALLELTLKTNRFTAAALHVPLPPLAGSPLFGGTNHIDLRLDADNTRTNQSVGPTRIAGTATLVSVVAGRPYLDSQISGTFLLFKPPTPASTNDVPLTTAP